MNLRKATLSAILCAPLLLMAKGTITGVVVNKDTSEPMDYANVQLINATTGKPLAIGTQTDDQGYFTLKDVPDGKYYVKVSSLGSIDNEREVKVAGKDVIVGTMKLADDSKMLQEVVVEGVRGQMRFELDRKVFTVDSSIAAAGQSASELLESIPSVEVDQDGEVSLRGNSSVTVWINGKDSGLTADNRAQILEQIPAETIEKIEVITNPSAKYSPEGTAGIINIVLKKDRRGGYFGAAEIGANTRGGGNASFNINYNNSKWDAYASVGFRMRHGKGGSWSRRENGTTDADGDFTSDGTYLNSDASSHNHGNNVFVRAGGTYHATDKDDISASAFGMFGYRWTNSNTIYHTNWPSQGWLLNDQLSRSTGKTAGAHAELGYQHRWTDTHTIDFTLGYNHWGGPMWNSYFQHRDVAEGETPIEDIYQEQNQGINTNSVEVKLDYVNHLTSWLKLEAGFNGSYSHENTPVSTYVGTTPDKTDLRIEENLFNTFIYNNNISALYFTLGGKYKNFSFSAGLRGESWQVKTRSLAFGELKDEVNPFKTNKFGLFPSAYVSWSLPHDNELQINYTRRIRRPWGGQLNSFRNISDPTNISYGNPELQPSYSNAFELNYIKSWRDHMISASAYLRTNENIFNRISYLYDNVMYTTNENVTDQQNIGLEIVAKNTFFNGKLDFTTTGNVYYSHIDGWSMMFNHEGHEIPVSGRAQKNFSWDLREMISIRLPWDLSIQITGRYHSRQLTAQGSHGASYNVDAGIRKNLGNWSFSLNCRDVFDSRKMEFQTYGDTYHQTSKRWRNGRTLSFSVKFSFGNMKSKKKPDMGGMDSMPTMDSYEGGGMQ